MQEVPDPVREDPNPDEWTSAPAPSTLDGTYAGPALRSWQATALDRWRAAGHRGIVEAITGTGKSLVGVAAIHETVVVGGGRALVLVPTRALLKQWALTLRRYLPGTSIGLLTGGQADTFRDHDVLVATIQSAYRAQPIPISLGLVVADEVHRYGSQAFSKALHKRYERRLGLTGTLERQLDEGVEQYLLPYFGKVTSSYGYASALEDEVVAPFHLALIGVEFASAEAHEYKQARERCSDAMTDLVEHFDYPTEWSAFFAAVNARLTRDSYWDEERQLCSSYMSAFAERRRLTAEAEGKESFVGTVAPELADMSGSLIFTETKESARRLAYIVDRHTSAFPLTSDSSAIERDETIRAFEHGRLKALCAPRILDEGIDVPEAEFAMVVAASQTPRQMIQRMGRVIRLKKDGRPARIAILYVRETGEDPAREGHFGFLEQVRPLLHRSGWAMRRMSPVSGGGCIRTGLPEGQALTPQKIHLRGGSLGNSLDRVRCGRPSGGFIKDGGRENCRYDDALARRGLSNSAGRP
ncbi:DEAD/DEAH box helicase [Leifsonia poae]|uniref:DEAD/DEAH box helicase n=1 Tax=Leifsonia poae TaxID=110933 RepID=UPI003D68B83D